MMSYIVCNHGLRKQLQHSSKECSRHCENFRWGYITIHVTLTLFKNTQPHVPLETRRGCPVPGTGRNSVVSLLMGVLGTELWSCGRAGALTCRVLSRSVRLWSLTSLSAFLLCRRQWCWGSWALGRLSDLPCRLSPWDSWAAETAPLQFCCVCDRS